jgi:SpoVK/Ycf46/Vps4 family AAA+-type ATPase
MIESKTEKSAGQSFVSWEEANWSCLQMELKRLRLLLHRRILWLRRQWKHDPLQEYQGLVISDAHADWLISGEDHQAEAQFYDEDKNASTVSKAIGNIETAIEMHIKAMTEAGQPPGLTFLVNLFGLSTFEQDVLLLCLAPELDPAFERLYAYVQDDITKKFPTPYLAITLFGERHHDGNRNCFLPTAPLRHYHMVTLEDSQQHACSTVSRPLHLDERIGHYIRGANYLDERIDQCVGHSRQTITVAQHGNVVNKLEQVIRSNVAEGLWPCINLIGSSKSEKLSVSQDACYQMQYKVQHIDITKLPSGHSERWQLIRLFKRESIMSRLAYYIDASAIDLSNENEVETVNDLVENIKGLVFLESQQRWGCRRDAFIVEIPDIDNDSRTALWKEALRDIDIDEKDSLIDDVIQQFLFSPESIVSIATETANYASNGSNKRGKAALSYEDVWNICRKHAATGMDNLAQRIVSVYAWDDIVLPGDTKMQLLEIADQAGNRATVYETWGFGEKLSRGRGISALFSGPSGTGKTMAAEIMSNDLKLDLHRIDLSSVVSKYIGQTEKNLRKVFDAAERSGAILFFDEADALFAKRTEIRDSHDRYANLEVNYLLQRMEDYRGLAILATNNKSALDRAFMRRIRFIVDFPFPDSKSRQSIWEKSFPAKAPVNGLEWNALARLEIPGGNIRNIALNASFLAAEEGKSVDMNNIMHAARREYMKIDKLITESEFGKHYNLIKV